MVLLLNLLNKFSVLLKFRWNVRHFTNGSKCQVPIGVATFATPSRNFAKIYSFLWHWIVIWNHKIFIRNLVRIVLVFLRIQEIEKFAQIVSTGDEKCRIHWIINNTLAHHTKKKSFILIWKSGMYKLDNGIKMMNDRARQIKSENEREYLKKNFHFRSVNLYAWNIHFYCELLKFTCSNSQWEWHTNYVASLNKHYSAWCETFYVRSHWNMWTFLVHFRYCITDPVDILYDEYMQKLIKNYYHKTLRSLVFPRKYFHWWVSMQQREWILHSFDFD